MLKGSSSAIALSEHSPQYRYHVADNVVALDKERLMGVLQFDGMPFNTVETEVLTRFSNRQTRVLNEMGKINGPRLSVVCHTVKRRVDVKGAYFFDNEFLDDFNSLYASRFKGGSFFQTRYYFSIVFKYKGDLDAGIKEVQQLLSFIESSLSEFSPRTLGVKINVHGVNLSEIGSFLSFLASGDDAEVPLSSQYIVDLIDQGSVYLGFDFAEFRPSSGKMRYGAMYDLRSHPTEGKMGQWNFLLKEPCEFIFSQSFSFWPSHTTLKMLDSKSNKLKSSSNTPDHLVDELNAAKPFVSSGELVFGEHQGALIVFGDTPSKTLDAANNLVANFSGSGDTSFRRATASAIFTYLSIFPGSKYKSFKEPKTTRNLACGFSLHTYPSGKATGNPIGDGSAILPLETDDGSIFFYNTHVTPIGVDNRGDAEPGHVLSLGMTGAGKTTLEAVIVNYMSRFDPAIFAIDYNKSMINNIRGPLRGVYFRIEPGIDSGINPFQWPDSPSHRDFLYQLVELLAGHNTSAEEKSQIKMAVDTVMDFDESQDRRLSHVHANIPERGGNGLRERLAQWVHSTQGRHAWALDSATNKFNPLEMFRVGFDATPLLVEKNPVTEPLLATLFQMKNMMQQARKGQPLITMVAEFWAPANYPMTANEIKKILKAGRLKGEICMLSSQSPESALSCLIVDDIVQQTPTKNLLPNVDANWEGYQKLGVSRKDFDELLLLGKDSRKFIIKQGRNSAIASINLSGFDEFMPIISSSDSSIEEVDKLITELGNDDPDVWLPVFRERIREKNKLKGEVA
ncbi:VirB4 family type IV secretion/conjugal transfer ATPase [Halomonas sp. 3D7M]|uniref:VirB4 family type IV secretion/conjugal transfer ATPase n=1 Tax=Halomonas sp. 3D7M TaxID=2742617 RepID=UPI001867E740|nr:conjugal transfer protein TraE [Halomonas sp. 3D7M]